jgi:hypothetical protein
MAKKRNTTGLGLIGGGLTDAPVTPQTRQNKTYIPPLGTISQATRPSGDDISTFARNLMGAAQLTMKAASNWASVDRGQGAIAGAEALPTLLAEINNEDPRWNTFIYDEDGKLRDPAELSDFVKNEIGDPGGSGWFNEQYEARVYPQVLAALYSRGAEHRGEFIAGETTSIVEGILNAPATFDPGGPNQAHTPTELYEVALDQSAEPLFNFYPKRAKESDDLYQTRIQGIWHGTIVEPLLKEVAQTGNMHLWRAITNRHIDAEFDGGNQVQIEVIDPDTGVTSVEFKSAPSSGWMSDPEARDFYMTRAQRADALKAMQRGMLEHSLASFDNPIPLDHFTVESKYGDESSLSQQAGADGITFPVSNVFLLPWVDMGSDDFVSHQEAFDRFRLGGDPLQDGDGPLLTSDVKPLIGGRSTTFNGLAIPVRSIEDIDKYLSSAAIMDPDSPIYMNTSQRDQLRERFLDAGDDNADAERIARAMNGMLGSSGDITRIVSGDSTGVIDYFKGTHQKHGWGITEDGTIENGLLMGFQIATGRHMPPRLGSMLFDTLMRNESSTEQRNEAIHLLAALSVSGGTEQAAWDQLVSQASNHENRLAIEYQLMHIKKSAGSLGLITPSGNLSVAHPNALEMIRSRIDSLSDVREVDPRALSRAIIQMGWTSQDSQINVQEMTDHLSDQVSSLAYQMGTLDRTEPGLGVAIDVADPLTNDLNTGRLINWYSEILAGVATENPGLKDQWEEMANTIFKTRFQATHSLVVLDDHNEGSPYGQWIYTEDLDFEQKWTQQMTKGDDGEQKLSATPWTQIMNFVAEHANHFDSSGARGTIKGIDDLGITSFTPHPSGKGWVAWNTYGQAIGWTPPKDGEDDDPQLEVFVIDLQQLNRWNSDNGFNDAYWEAVKRKRAPTSTSRGKPRHNVRGILGSTIDDGARPYGAGPKK